MAASAISATSSTETHYPVLINGYLCYSAAEARAARQLINPRTLKQTTTGESSGRADASFGAATSHGVMNTLRAYTAQATSRDDENDIPRRGSRVNILA